ncbi:hypothetical protein [Paraburkholderia tagetis]|uniref:Lipoprotein n=1 Tax=Paraburkholderia tagetis TaxID=2913261 RepID=A0A9X1RT79_9BURK|nr:hypothetical protein [Paraburkholderia tagetis]MCG5075651.1 hypothetical protein [Paraburkholderia tagetis]
MKSRHLKLAGIVTVIGGSMCSFEAGAAVSDSPAIATGPVRTMQGAPQDVADATNVTTVPPRHVAATAPPSAPPSASTSAPDAMTDGRHSVSRAVESISAPEDADPAWSSANLVAVSERRLDDMRGGFDLPSGLVVSFGISRAAFVNGNLVAQTSFNIPNVANMTAQQAQMLASANTGALVQVGPNNSVQQGALPGMTGSVIQNTLSGQQIQALTTINTSVNSLGAFKAMNFLSTLNSSLAGAVRPR